MIEQDELASMRRSRLKAWMLQYQVSRTELARRIEVGRAYVSLLLKEERSDEPKKRHFGEKTARAIEAKLLLPRGYLDSEEAALTSVFEWSTPGELPENTYAMVQRVSVRLAAGTGCAVDEELDLPPLAFRSDWLSSQNVTARKNLRILEVQGDSMEGCLSNGDVVMVDMGQTTIQENGIYAIRYGDELRIKRLSKRIGGGVYIRSDNPKYPEESIDVGQMEYLTVLGKALWRAGSI